MLHITSNSFYYTFLVYVFALFSVELYKTYDSPHGVNNGEVSMGFIFAILFLICILWAIFYFELSRLHGTAIIIFDVPLRCYFLSVRGHYF